MRRRQAMVFSLALRFLRDPAVAEEIAQEVFLSLYRNWANIESEEHAASWLRKVAVQRAIDEGRKRARRPMATLDEVAPIAAKETSGDFLMQQALRKLVASLPEMQRMITILRYQEDLDPSEIARILDMPVATVKSYLQRSLALLREKVARLGLGGAESRSGGK